MKWIVLVASAGALGCASTTLADLDRHNDVVVSRDIYNEAKLKCMLPTADCRELAQDALHASAWTMRKSWSEPVDRDLARQALKRGCDHARGEACRMLVEFELTTSADERAWAIRRAAFYGEPVRPKADVDAEQAQLRAEAAKADAENARLMAEAQADLDAHTPGFFDTVAQASVMANRAYRVADEANAATRAATNTKLGIAERVDETLHHANEASRIATDRPLLGDDGILVDICVPCTDEAKRVAAACKSGMTDDCLGVTKKLSACFEKNQCDKD